MDVNIPGVAYICHAVTSVLIEKGFRHLVDIASLVRFKIASMLAGYSAKKHTVTGLTRSLRFKIVAELIGQA